MSAENFPGERYIHTPMSIATEMELRNRPWPGVLEHARRAIRFSQYSPYSDIWVPNNLKQGDIIRCDLPTDYQKKGTPEIWPRNVMVLGINVAKDPETELIDIASIAVMRLSYNIDDMDEERDLFIDMDDPEFRWGVTGLRKHAVLRTSSAIDIVTPTSEFFGFYMDKIGSVSPELFGKVEDKIAAGYESRMHRPLRNHFSVRSANTMFIPSLDSQDIESAHDFMQDENLGRDFFDMDDEQIDELLLDLELTAIEKANERRTLLRRQKDTADDLRQQAWQEKLKRTKANKMRRSRLRGKDKTAFLDAIRKVRTDIENQDDVHQQELVAATADPDHVVAEQEDISLKTLEQMLSEHMDPEKQVSQQREAALEAISGQEIREESIADLQNFGIGGLMRETTIDLPEYLWRGRFLMMRIPDLRDSSNMTQAFRPCIIHKAYAKINDDGEPELAGMELFPCTQSAAHHFRYKMPVMPLGKAMRVNKSERSKSSHLFGTVARKPSWLIADVMIRAPLSTEYFQPDQNTNFLQMPRSMVEKFDGRIEHCRQNEGEHFTYGLQDVPDDWIEIDLPPVPTDPKIQEYTGARFHEKVPAHVQRQIDNQKKRRNARTAAKHDTGSAAEGGSAPTAEA